MALRLDELPSQQEFARRQPFSWVELPDVLTSERFERLRQSFPDVGLFEHHVGRPRPHGQRPHDRYYLAFEQSVHDRSGRGVVNGDGLDGSWQALIDELRSPPYLDRIRELFAVDDLVVRFAWHIGMRGSEVSPHRDAPVKLGTHLFYFNSEADWSTDWGGATELLGGKRGEAQNPEFEDFDRSVVVANVATSLLFMNRPDAWHGVRRLDCPPTARRLLFTVVFDRPSTAGRIRRSIGRVRGRLGA